MRATVSVSLPPGLNRNVVEQVVLPTAATLPELIAGLSVELQALAGRYPGFFDISISIEREPQR